MARSDARAAWEEKRRDERDAGADPRIPWAELDDEQQRVLVSEEFATPEQFEQAWAVVTPGRELGTPDPARPGDP